MSTVPPRVLILGASSDIAQACAYAFASQNHSLTLAARNCSRLEPLKSDIALKFNVEVELVEFDALAYATNQAQLIDWAKACPVCLVAFGNLYEQKEAEAKTDVREQLMSVNYNAVVHSIEPVSQVYLKQSRGYLIAISSVAGDRGRMSNYIYGSAKAATTTYLAGLRHKLSHAGLGVLTVKPGFVSTKMTAHLPLPKPVTASPQQVANDIYKAYKKQKNGTLYTLWMWRYIMLIIKNLPAFIFHKTKM